MSLLPFYSFLFPNIKSPYNKKTRQAKACRVLSFCLVLIFSSSGILLFRGSTFGQAPPMLPLPPQKSAAKPITPFGPPLPPIPTQPRRAALVGGLTPILQAQIAHVDIDATTFIGTLPTLWRGTVYRTPVQEVAQQASQASPDTDALTVRNKNMAGLLKSSGSTLARINPFAAPGVVTMDPDGTPIVRWESVDFLLKQTVERGEDVVFSLHSATAWPSAAANTLIGATLRRYALSQTTPIARWELACVADNAPTRYAAFARLARVLVPGIPIGLNISSGDAAEGIRQTAALCAQDKLPLNSVAWNLSDQGGAAEKSARLVRRALAAFPSLKNTLLLPTLHSMDSMDLPGSSNTLTSGTPVSAAQTSATAEELMGETPDVARLASLGARLMQVAPQEAANPLIGVLAEERMVIASPNKPADKNLGGDLKSGYLSQKGQMLALLNRMAGTRLQARSDVTGLGCLAIRAQQRILVLLWREPQADSMAAVHPADSASCLALVRLHRMPFELSGKARILRFEPGDFTAGLAATARTATPAPAKTTLSETKSETNISANSLLPIAVADVPEDNRFLPTEMELPALLAPGSACLLEVMPVDKKFDKGHTPPSGTAENALQWTLETTSANLRGGDTLDLILSAHNISLQPRKLEVVLTASLPDVLPQTVTKTSLGLIPSKGSRAFHFALNTPIVSENAVLAVNVLANHENSLSLTVPVLPALEVTLDTSRADVEAATGNSNIRTRLVNLTHHTLKLRLRANGTQGTTVTLPPARTPVLSVVALSPPTHVPGVYPVALRIENQDRLLRTLHPLCGVPFLCPSIATRPAIDGDLSKWAEGEPLGMGQAEQAHGKPWKGPTDLSAYAYTRWDAQYFYFACAVTDDVFFQPYSAADMERGDSVQFAIASDALSRKNGNGGVAASRNNGHDYVKFGMALLKAGKNPQERRPPEKVEQAGTVATLVRFPDTSGNAKRAAPVSVKGALVAIRHEGTRTFYEAAIPWVTLQSTPPHPGDIIRMSIVVNDNDGQGRGYMEWGGNLAERPQPLLFPAFRLTK